MKNYGLHFAWIVALVATLGSLFFGEFSHQEPCRLCWFQRILMYPLAIILGIAAFRHATRIILYVLPLSLGGLALSLYHVISVEFFPSACAVCKISALSQESYSFPLLSCIAFALINIFLIWTALLNRRSKKF